MSRPPLPNSTEPGLSGPAPFALQTPENFEGDRRAVAAAILTLLREALATGTHANDAILQATVDAAQIITGADGAAIALQVAGVVICRARSGNIAPELGAALNIDSGISGESFRTGQILRCDDTNTDTRVDPEVCNYLGICSIVVVPIVGPLGTIGILEGFSSKTRAFDEQHMSFLKDLAEIAEAVHRRESGTASTKANDFPDISRNNFPPVERAVPSTAPSPAHNDPLPKTRHHYWVLAGALVLMLLACGVVWWTWHEPPEEGSAQPSTAQAATIEGEKSGASSLSLPAKPSPRIANGLMDHSSSKHVLQNAAQLEKDSSVKAILRSGVDDNEPEGALKSPKDAPAAQTIAAAEPPTVVFGNPDSNNTLATLASAPEPMPALDVRVSQGVTSGGIAYKVQPIYPQKALAQRLGGSVVLDVSVGEDGAVRDVRIRSGDSLFLPAAVAAVRLWRYSPSLLNGKPIAVEKEVTILFKP